MTRPRGRYVVRWEATTARLAPEREEAAMGMGEAFITCMKKYADFNGRARRSEYWWFYLVLMLIQLPFQIVFFVGYLAFFIDMEDKADAYGNVDWEDLNFGTLVVPLLLLTLVSFVFLLPSYAAQARRLHDMGQSGLWVLLNLAGIGIVPLVLCIMNTQPGPNQWGPDPKAAERVAYGYPLPPGYPPGATYSPPPGSPPSYPTITPPDA